MTGDAPQLLDGEPVGDHGCDTPANRRGVLDEVVAADGEPITLQGVAKRADLSLRTLYNHFPNREALLARRSPTMRLKAGRRSRP